MVYTCTTKAINKAGDVVAYIVIDNKQRKYKITTEQLIEKLRNKKIVVKNIKLGADGKLVILPNSGIRTIQVSRENENNSVTEKGKLTDAERQEIHLRRVRELQQSEIGSYLEEMMNNLENNDGLDIK